MAKKVIDPLEAIWYVTWSCGHRELLEETLPKCVWSTNILVVDYSCPQHAGDWVAANTKAKMLRVEAQRLLDDSPVVSRARALNAALRHLRGQWVLLGDPQLYPVEGTRDAVMQAASVHGQAVLAQETPVPAALGLLAAPVDVLLDAGGYLPAYVGHGAEAPDLRLRMEMCGVTPVRCDIPIGVATGQRNRFWGSQSLLEGRFELLTGQPASMLAATDRPRAEILGLLM
jgi:hypothetical protein